MVEQSPPVQAQAVAQTRAEGGLLAGRFRLVHWVGGVAGTSLWQATDELLGRPVAVHMLGRIPVSADLTAAVQAAARVNDVRLAAVFDACFDHESCYLVSEWASEPTLEQLLLAKLPEPALAAEIVADAARALAAAHAGLCSHLCLTPRCLHWGDSGLKITGLGIDAALSGADERDLDAKGQALTDTVALAQILYALLTGYWPGDPAATVLRSAPRTRAGLCEPRQLRPEIPALLNAITCHALPGQPGWGALSIRTPGELAAALRPALRPDTCEIPVQPAAAHPAGRPAPVPGPRHARPILRPSFVPCAG